MKAIKHLLTLALCLGLVSQSGAIQRAKDLTGVSPEVRLYLDSVEKGMQGESAWKSNAQVSLATSSYITTSTIYFNVQLVDDDNRRMWWFNDAIPGFSVSSTASVTGVTHGATLGSSTLTFYSGSAGASVILTGVWAVGNTITVSAPALSQFISTVSTKSVQVVSFTTN